MATQKQSFQFRLNEKHATTLQTLQRRWRYDTRGQALRRLLDDVAASLAAGHRPIALPMLDVPEQETAPEVLDREFREVGE